MLGSAVQKQPQSTATVDACPEIHAHGPARLGHKGEELQCVAVSGGGGRFCAWLPGADAGGSDNKPENERQTISRGHLPPHTLYRLLPAREITLQFQLYDNYMSIHKTYVISITVLTRVA